MSLSDWNQIMLLVQTRSAVPDTLVTVFGTKKKTKEKEKKNLQMISSHIKMTSMSECSKTNLLRPA